LSQVIRQYTPEDLDAVVDLALRACSTVFASLQRELGADLFTRLHGDWREFQAAAVRGVLGTEGMRVWVRTAGAARWASWPRPRTPSASSARS
jgi:hypothetical protein